VSAVDPLFAQWLQGPADFAVRTDPVSVGRWGSTALSVERISGIATRAAAEAEADRQLAFFARGPFAIDVHQLVGTDWIGSLGRIVTLKCDYLGYEAGLDVMVIGVDADRSTAISSVTVVRPLRSVS
jgi:hypothetical protein